MASVPNITEKEVIKVFENCMKNYRKVDVEASLEQILERQLPKVRNNDITKLIIDKVNEVLSAEISADITVEDLHTLTYCGGKTVTQLCEKYDKIFVQSKIPQKFPNNEDEQRELFENSPQQFRRLLFEQSLQLDEAYLAPIEKIEEFWTEIWGKKSTCNEEEKQKYEKQEIDRLENKFDKSDEEEIDQTVTKAELKKAWKNKKLWSPPGIDGVQTFWYKKLKPIRKALLKIINKIITGKEEMPDFFTLGLTYMLPKSGDTQKAKNYRPITHLPTIYKIITRCIHQKIFQHYEEYGILTDEQCGGRRGYYGVRKALVIDAVALDQKVYGRYVDFAKAFDSVPHEWILKLLEIYHVRQNIRDFLKNAMGKWQTRICMMPDSITSSISIKNGVFHGDCISVMLFWTALNPLSVALQNSNGGLNLDEGGVLSHLLYMDDLKLYASSTIGRKANYRLVKKFTEAIGMQINTKKTHDFSTVEKMKSEQVYLGYIQNPNISSKDTIYHKVRKFEEKYKKIETTHISDEDKSHLQKHFLLSSIFNTFGILDWTVFKRELLKTEVPDRLFLPEVKEHCEHLETIYKKMINDMCRMRIKFFEQAEESKLMANIVENDRVTPLKLAQKDNKKYITGLVERVGETGRRKRKVTDIS